MAPGGEGKTTECNGTESISTDDDLTENPAQEIPDFFLDLGPRFNPMTREELMALQSIEELLPEEKLPHILSYQEVGVHILNKEGRLTENSQSSISELFSHGQLIQLQSLDLSADIMFEAICQERIPHSGQMKRGHYTPHYTLVPERQAEYQEDKGKLIEFLREGSIKEAEEVDPVKLRPGQIRFTVGTDGRLKDARVIASTTYPHLDARMVELISSAPGVWSAAQDALGQAVEQELILYYGAIGC